MPTLAKQLEALGSQLGRHQRKLTNIQKDIRRLRAQVAELSSNRSSSPGGDHGGDLAAAAVTIISNLAAITAATPSGQGWASKPPLLLPLTAGGGSWTPLGNLSEGSVSGAPFRGRSDHGMVAHGKYVYVIGGYGTLAGGSGSSPGLGSGPGSEVVLDEMIRYDTETGLWELMARMPERRCRFATALLGDAIYVIAGTALAGFQGGPSDSVLVYNITADTWTVGPRLVAPRIDACAAALDDKVYVFGGYDPAYVSLSSVEVLEVAGTGGSSGSGAGAARGNGSASVWRLLPQDSWMTEPRADCRAVAVTPPPLPRKPTTAATASPSYSPAPATATAAPVIVVAGGVQYFTPANKSCDGLLWVNCYRMLRSVHVFDPRQALLAASTGTGTGTGTSSGGAAGGGRGWRALAPMLWPRADFGLAVLPGGRLLAAGGEWGNGISFQLARQQVEEFSWGGPGGAGGPDAARGVWVAKAPLPEARFRTELVYVGGGAAITLGGVPTCGRTPNGRMADADACYRKYSATGFTYHDDRYAAAAATAALAQSSLDVAGGGGLMGSEDADDAAGAREAVEAVTALLPQLFAALHNDTRGNL